MVKTFHCIRMLLETATPSTRRFMLLGLSIASVNHPFDTYSYAPRDGHPIDETVHAHHNVHASDNHPFDTYWYASRDGHPTENGDLDDSNNIRLVTSDMTKKEKAEQSGARFYPGLFFRATLLKEGTTIPLFKIAGADTGPSQYFLPRSVASMIPISASVVSKIFNIPTDSAMYRAMKGTIDLCRIPPNTGETKQCVTSIEDMIDYALSTLGANTGIQVWSTHNTSGFGGDGMIGKVRVVYDGELTAKAHVTCHKLPFPYLVYLCHNVFKARIYDIDILNAETKEKINQGAAVCHLDTTEWRPDHMAFAALESVPGKTEVCHWMFPSDMALTASDVAAPTATAIYS